MQLKLYNILKKSLKIPKGKSEVVSELKNDRQYNGQKNKEKRTNMVMMFNTTFSDLQNITQKTKDQAAHEPH